jgi:hypothetical protein
MNEVSEQIRELDVENSIVVDKNGNVFQFVSNTEDSVQLFDVDLDNATIIHNHPESNGIVSFGEDDFYFLREHQNVKSFRCCNADYNYSVTVLNDMSKLAYNPLYIEAMKSTEYSLGEDLQHVVFDILRKKGYVHYERTRLSRN